MGTSRKLLSAKDLMRVRASAAETARTDAVAVAHGARRAAADVAVVRSAAAASAARSYMAAAAQAAVLFGVLGLVVDLYVHEDPEYIEARVRRALRASVGAPPATALAPAPALPVLQSPPALGYKPLMILGPMGCGKSTLLQRAAREAASSRTPIVLVRWRLSQSVKREATAAARESGEDSLAIASEALFRQIGYPVRRAVLVSALKSGVTGMGQKTQADLALPQTRDRLQHALRVLFRAAADVKRERVAAGVPDFAATPVLLFDGVDDLVKDERLARGGGEAVFRTLALMLICYCVDQHAVRAMVAGSSGAELCAALRAAAPYNGRWDHYELRDPEAGAVVAALQARGGYAEEDARALVAECGTRMRLLEGPLLLGAGGLPASDFLVTSAAAGDEALRALFCGLSASDARRLARSLSAIAAADAAGSGAGAAGAARPLAADLPHPVRAAGAAYTGAIYEDRWGRAHFQARNVAHAWERRERQGGWGG